MAATPPSPQKGPADIPTPTSLSSTVEATPAPRAAGQAPISPPDESPLVQQDLPIAGDGGSDDYLLSSVSCFDRVQAPLNPGFNPAVPFLLNTPAEILDLILRHLSPYDLASVAATCRQLRGHALSDVLWYRIAQDNVPGVRLKEPTPFDSYYKLFAEHDPLWFLPKHKIWFSDSGLPGKLILVRYNPRLGCIEGFDLLAMRKIDSPQQWPANPQVNVHLFSCRVGLHLDKPVLEFKIGDRKYTRRGSRSQFSEEINVCLDDRLQHMYSTLILTKPLDEEMLNEGWTSHYPYGNVWPPRTIPASTHVFCDRSDTMTSPAPALPTRRSELSDKTFRMRRWMEMMGTSASTRALLERMARTVSGIPHSPPDLSGANFFRTGPVGIHMGEDVMTYSTLDPELYTPTPTKPWRGIWVGDYSSHGCEFLLFHQPDDPPASDEELNLVRQEGETNAQWEERRLEARINRGSLQAIKLTGDGNVPRGEYTFIAEDIGPQGTVSVPPGPPFEDNPRAVRSRGHVAHTGFQRDEYIASQLMLISYNRIAQYWIGLDHISFFERIDIDSHLDPETLCVEELGL